MKNRVYLSEFSCVLVIVLAGFIVYSNTFDVPFYFDDLNNIEQNSAIHLEHLNLKSLYRSAFEGHIPNRPVANLSLALNWYFHQTHVEGYHWVNNIIHILNGILVFYLIRLTLNSPALKNTFNYQNLAALVCALLWLVHPLHTQSVTYIIQRMNSMCALFYLLSFVCFIKSISIEKRWEKGLFLFGVIVFWIFALGSKEIAVTLPFFAFLYFWFFYQDLQGDWLKKKAVYLIFAIIVAACIAMVYLGINPIATTTNAFSGRDFTLEERLLTEFRVVVYYISLAFFPHPSRLHLDYDFPLSVSLIDPVSTLMSVLFIVALLALSVASARKHRLLSFAILWFFGNLFLESSFIALDIIYEHRTYLPLVFIVAVPVVYVTNLFNRPIFAIIPLCIIFLFGRWAFERNSIWQNPIKFWEENIEKASAKPRPYSELGMVYGKKGELDNAKLLFDKALDIDPKFVDALNNMGTVAAMRGDIAAATEYFKEAVALKPYKGEAQLNLGRVLLMQKKAAESIIPLQQATRLMPVNGRARFILGQAYLQNGDFDFAAQSFSVVLEKDPSNATVQRYLNFALQRVIPKEND